MIYPPSESLFTLRQSLSLEDSDAKVGGGKEESLSGDSGGGKDGDSGGGKIEPSVEF